MQSNKKYTALEILQEAGFEKPEEKIGKFRVIIGGLQGIVKPDHIIRVSAGTEELEVVVGIEKKIISIEDELAEQANSKEVQKVLKKRD